MSIENRIRVAVVGAAGYSGEELLRLLIRHPQVEIVALTSRQYAGKAVGEVFPRFAEMNLEFSLPDTDRIAEIADTAFLALPHGLAAEYAVPLYEKGLRVLDLSADFRLRNPSVYQQYYHQKHPKPELLNKAVYGLPEIYRETLSQSRLVACPGCYPTSILVPVCPLLKEKAAAINNIVAVSLSGVSGAGRKVDLPYLFPECNESLRAYGLEGHRHLPEIRQELARAAGTETVSLNFIPHLVPVTRGIYSTIMLERQNDLSTEEILDLWRQNYDGEPFVRILGDGKTADTKHVTMTNMIEIGCRVDAENHRIIVTSSIDNLTKGAAGQAVQCLNIMAGFPEVTGLL